MRIAVIGIGNVGRTLGRRWSEVGHEVTFCVRDEHDPQKREEARNAHARLAPLGDAHHAEVILLAVPWPAVPEVLEATGDLCGKPLLDCTNPLNSDFTALTTGHSESAGERVARMAPSARVVKIFNTNGAKNMANPDYGNIKVTMLYAGDDEAANGIAAKLAAEIGFEPICLGGLKESRLLEPVAMTWIILARHRGFGRDFALNFVRRPGA